MSDVSLDEKIAAVRAFNRFYTKVIGLLDEGLLKSPYSLTEARVLYELAVMKSDSASKLAKDLRLDPAYLSRILSSFRTKNLVSMRKSARDGREQVLALTQRGRKEFARLDKGMYEVVAGLLEPLPEAKSNALIAAMNTVRTILGPEQDGSMPWIIRPPRPGDVGWVVHRHGALYTREFGWDGTFETFVAEIASDFLKTQNPERDRGWIAERDGAIVGSVFIVDGGESTAKLRLLYVEPETRGLGIGARLVDEALSFARSAGYDRVTLFTTANLVSARRIYEAAGFVLVSEEKERRFGKDLVFQTWTLEF